MTFEAVVTTLVIGAPPHEAAFSFLIMENEQPGRAENKQKPAVCLSREFSLGARRGTG